jgi:hypothetical protein
VFVLVTALGIASACSGGDGESPSEDAAAPVSTTPAITSPDSTTEPTTPATTEPPGDPSSDLECEQVGYPCSIAEVPAAILSRSGDLATEAFVRVDDDGQSMEDVADWLAELDDVAEVEADEGAIWFRVEGGQGLWLLADGPAGTRSSPAPTDGAHTAPASFGPLAVRAPQPAHVVAPGETIKSALVLSPVLFEFGGYDDGPIVADLLSSTPDYAGNVTFKGNESSTSTSVTIDDFETWRDYDLVHVSSHGRRICVQRPCRGMVTAGPLEAVLPPGPGDPIDKVAGLDILDRPGVSVSLHRDGTGSIALTADFFRDVYGGGLSDTFIFFNACQSLGGGQTDLAEAIAGTSSVFVGWSDTVIADDAIDAAVALYSDMAERGVTADDAYHELDPSVSIGQQSEGYGVPTLEIRNRTDGDHLRIREVVELLQPGTNDPLEIAEVPIVGTIGDGEPDSVPYRVRIDGHDELQAAGGVVHVSVDGVEAPPEAVDEGAADGEGSWTIDGTVDLGEDVDAERDANFRAWVELPDGGESFDEETATLIGEPIMGTRWELTGTHTGVFTNLPSTPSTETATLTLVFEEGQDNDEPYPRYVLEGGTVNEDDTSTYGDCSYVSDPFTYEVEPDDFFGIEFNTTVSPVQYRGYIWTQSTWFTRAENCGEGTTMREHRTISTWMDLREESRPITDATTIVGSQEWEDGCCYVRRTEFTIKRID